MAAGFSGDFFIEKSFTFLKKHLHSRDRWCNIIRRDCDRRVICAFLRVDFSGNRGSRLHDMR